MRADQTTSQPTAEAHLRKVVILVVAALAVTSSVRNFVPRLIHPWDFEDDAAQHVWWTYRFADASLFPSDIAADYFSLPTFAPVGYQAVYRTLVPLADAQRVSEVIPIVLTAITAVLGVLLGRAVGRGSWVGGLVGGVMATSALIVNKIDGGLPRAFAEPLLLFALWALVQRRIVFLGVAFVLTALFYPPLIVNLGLVTVFVLGIDWWRSRRLPKGWIALLVGIAIAAGVVAYAYARPMRPDFAPKITAADARAMPEFWQGGRSAFFSKDLVRFYFEGPRPGMGLSPASLALSIVGLILLARSFRGAIGMEITGLFVTSLGAFIVAHAVLFALHLPSRYTRYTFPVCALMVISSVVPRLAEIRPLARFARRLHEPRILAVIGAVIALCAATDAIVKVRRDLGRSPEPGLMEVLEFVSQLPKESVIAAHPSDASVIPLLTRRSTVANEEISLAYHMGYYRQVKARLTDELRACFAHDWSDVDALWSRYGARAFVVNTGRYADVSRPIYRQPFESDLRPEIEAHAKVGFVLARPPADRILFAAGNYVVVRVGPDV